jgi:predicted RNA methylase
MPTLDDIRKQWPDIAELDDENALQAIQQVHYPDLSVEQVAKAVGYTPPPPPAPGQFGSGLRRSFAEVPGMVAGAGAYVADVVGADQTRDKLLGYATEREKIVGKAHAQDATSVMDAWDGKTPWADWLANSAGYVAGQAFQSIATGGFGALGARMVARQGAKELAERAAAEAITKGASAEAAKAAAIRAVTQAEKKAMLVGAAGAAGGQNLTMELGSIYPDAVEQGGDVDLLRVGGAALAAATLDTAADALMARGIMKGVGGGDSIMARARKQVPIAMGREAATEMAQTGIEQWGAGRPFDLREAIDAGAIGAVGGGMGGGVASLKKADDPQTKAMRDLLGAKDTEGAIEAFNRTQAPLEMPGSGLDPQGAMARLVGSPEMPAAQPGIDPETGELVPPPTFKERHEALVATLEDSRIRQQIREGLGREALNDVLYYAQAARNPDLPGKTSDRMLDLAEMIVFRARTTRIDPLTGRPAAPQLAGPPNQPQIGLDMAPTGGMIASADGLVTPETRADVISRADRERAAFESGTDQTVGAPRPGGGPALLELDQTATGRMLAGAAGVVPETHGDAVSVLDRARQRYEQGTNATRSPPPPNLVTSVHADKRNSGFEGAPTRQGAFDSEQEAHDYITAQRADPALQLPLAVPKKFADGSWGISTDKAVVDAAVVPPGASLKERARLVAQRDLGIEPGDLTTKDGKPYGSQAAAKARATKDGGSVKAVKGGWVVRPDEPGQNATPLVGGSPVQTPGPDDALPATGGQTHAAAPAAAPTPAAPSAGVAPEEGTGDKPAPGKSETPQNTDPVGDKLEQLTGKRSQAPTETDREAQRAASREVLKTLAIGDNVALKDGGTIFGPIAEKDEANGFVRIAKPGEKGGTWFPGTKIEKAPEGAVPEPEEPFDEGERNAFNERLKKADGTLKAPPKGSLKERAEKMKAKAKPFDLKTATEDEIAAQIEKQMLDRGKTPAAPEPEPEPVKEIKQRDTRKASVRAKQRRAFNPDEDSLLQALAKFGGIARDVVEKEFGMKPEELGHFVHVGGLKGFPFRKTGGMQLDTAIETLVEAGFFRGVERDDLGTAFEEAIFDEIGGNPTYTAEGTMRRAAKAQGELQQQQAEEETMLEPAALTDDDQARREDELAEVGLTDADLEVLWDEDADALFSSMDSDTMARYVGAIPTEDAPDDQDPQGSDDRPGQAAPGEASPRGSDGGGEAGPAPAFTLETQDETSLKARAARAAARQKAEAAEQKRLEDKAKADAELGEFTLTGSDRAVDVGAAGGQTGMSDAPATKWDFKTTFPQPQIEELNRAGRNSMFDGIDDLGDMQEAIASTFNETGIAIQRDADDAQALIAGLKTGIDPATDKPAKPKRLLGMWNELQRLVGDAIDGTFGEIQAEFGDEAMRAFQEAVLPGFEQLQKDAAAVPKPASAQPGDWVRDGSGTVRKVQRADATGVWTEPEKVGNSTTEKFIPAGNFAVVDAPRAGDAVATSATEWWAAASKDERAALMRELGRDDLAEHKSLGKWGFDNLGVGTRAAIKKHLAKQGVSGGDPAPAPKTDKSDSSPPAPVQSKEDADAIQAGAVARKLREVAQKAIEEGEAKLNQDRNTNTARRARMASSAEADAAHTVFIGKKMLAIADALEAGGARSLLYVTSKALVEQLQSIKRQAMGAADRAANLSYREEEQRKGRPWEPQDVAFIKFPTAEWNSGAKDGILSALAGKKGAASLIKELQRSHLATPEQLVEIKKHLGEKAKNLIGPWVPERMAAVSRLKRAGIKDQAALKKAILEFNDIEVDGPKRDRVKDLERALVGNKGIGIDFFPTPKPVAARMVGMAGIEPGQRVLEPSAGNGNIADAVRAAGAQPDVVEVSDALRQILEAKGHTLVGRDFESYEPGAVYDRIVMNPPFGTGTAATDAAHVKRAFAMLRPGGRLVAIVSEGLFGRSDAKAKAFRAWLEEVNGRDEKLPSGTFEDKAELATTGVATRIIVVNKAPGTAERQVYEVRETDGSMDLFGLPMSGPRKGPTRPSARRSAAAPALPQLFDQPTAEPVVTIRPHEKLPGVYRVSSQLIETGVRPSPVAKVTSWAEAASALSAMRQFAVEHLDILITDKDGKPLAIVGSFKGAQTQTTAYPATILGEAMRLEGAAHAWGVHNHPSGNTQLSNADLSLNNTLRQHFQGSRIEYHGLAAVGQRGTWHAVTARGTTTDGALITDGPTTMVPIVERTIVVGAADPASRAQSADHARALTVKAGGNNPGILFLDAKNEVTAWVPVDPKWVGLTAQNRFDQLVNAATEASAVSAIIANPGGVLSGSDLGNYATALGRLDVQVVDVIDSTAGTSAAQLNRMPYRGNLLFSIADEDGPVKVDAAAKASPEHVQLVADLAQRLNNGPDGRPLFGTGIQLDAVEASAATSIAKAREMAAARLVAKRVFGHDVVFVKVRKGQQRRFNGVMSKHAPGVVFIDVETNLPMLSILGHELLHQLRARSPAAYATLAGRLNEVIRNAGDYRERLETLRARQGANADLGDWLEELHADIVGDRFMEPAFWRELGARGDRGMFQRVLQAVIRFLTTVLNRMVTGSRASEFVADVERAREAVVDAMAGFNQLQTEGSAEPGLRFAADAPVFYSAFAEAVRGSMMKKGDAAAWSAAFRGMESKGVKREEITWSGVEEWLALQPGKVAREDVAAFLAENGVRVTETVLGDTDLQEQDPDGLGDDVDSRVINERYLGEDEDDFDAETADREIDLEVDSDETYVIVGSDWAGSWSVQGQRGTFIGERHGSFNEARRAAEREYMDRHRAIVERHNAAARAQAASRGFDAPSKYGNYVLPGGENYRELLLTLPQAEGKPTRFQVQAPGGKVLNVFDSQELADDFVGRNASHLSDLKVVPVGNDAPAYRSSHWNEPNILAHIRMNDRTDADGKRVLFIEEIQSDWAQEGKRKGFATGAPDTTGWTAEEDTRRPPGNWRVWNAAGEVVSSGTIADSAEAAIAKMAASGLVRGIPAAPFVGKTDAWVALAMKRVVKLAVDGGYDRVAFVNGQQSADRYSLSKHVTQVEFDSKGKNGRKRVTVMSTGTPMNFQVDESGVIVEGTAPHEFGGKPLADVLGKGVAEKIMNTESGDLRGLDLDIGGEGMKAFYDKIVPSVAKDVLRKLGGEGLREVAINAQGPSARPAPDGVARSTQTGFDITPAMKAKADAGVPLFSIAGDSDIRFSLADNVLAGIRGFDPTAARDDFMDAMSGSKSTGWFNPVKTQYAKAQANPKTFGRVFNAVQDYLRDVSTFANAAADQAPTIIHKLEDFRSALPAFMGGRKDARRDDLDAAGAVLWRGTLADLKAYSREELAAEGLTETQQDLYFEARAAIDQSLDDLIKTELVRLAGKEGMYAERAAMAADSPAAAAEVFNEYFAAMGIENNFAELAQDKVEQGERLKAEGYAPLMRFGEWTVHVTDAQQNTIFFGMYETKMGANKAARELREDPQLEGMDFQVGEMSQEESALYQGLSLDALELFATVTGNSQNEVYQEFLRKAKNNRSALKRLIRRQGIAGFSEDTSRVLASFITSNARAASGNLHMGRALEAAEAVPKHLGKLRDEGIKLVKYVQNPQEEAGLMRGLLFVNFIGGSVASAAVNLTQTFTMALPYLSQFGGARNALGHLVAAWRLAAGGDIEGDLGQAIAIAERNGTISPQEIHHLQAEAAGTIRNPYVRKAAFIWGSMFSLAEQFNRRSTFIAAYNAALEQGLQNAQAFAEKAVIETQGLYNKGNKPNMARGPIGATVMTFKQFSIHYIEFLNRMWKSGPEGKKAVGLALGIIVLTAGTSGLPGADDLDDLIDTLAQALGYDFSSKKAKKAFVAETLGLGDGAADFASRGITGISGMPFDVSLRMSFGNLLPGTGILLRSNTDRARDVLEFAGAAGSMGKSLLDAGGLLLSGEPGKAGMKMAPLAIQNLAKGIGMWNTGEYRNERGQKVVDVGPGDAFLKGIGFQPGEIARETQVMQQAQRSINLAKNVTEEIASAWAQALNDGDTAGVRDAQRRLREWNDDNPDTRLKISMQGVINRVRNMRMSRADRVIKSAPTGMRQGIAETLQ